MIHRYRQTLVSPNVASIAWLNSVSVQANWFVSVSPLAFCLGVLLSIVASERLGRLTTEKHMSSLKYCNHLTNLGTNSLARKDDHVNSWQFHQVWGFQEDDVCPEQFHSTTLLCSSLFCSKFRSLDRWEKVKASKKYSNPIFAVGRIIQCIGIGLGATTAAVFLTEVAIFLLLLNLSDNVWFLSSQRSQCFYFFSTLVAVFSFFSTWVKMWLYSKGNSA